MRIQETERYKRIVNVIRENQTAIDFLATLKNSECGYRIKMFCENETAKFTPTEEYRKTVTLSVYNSRSIIVTVPDTDKEFYYHKVNDGFAGYNIDSDISYCEHFMSVYLKEKNKLDRCTLDVSIDDAREFYNGVIDHFQIKSWWIYDANDDDNIETYLKAQACVKYGIAYSYDDTSIIVEGRQLYMIDGELFKGSQIEIDTYCMETGKTARKVEPRYIKEV